MLRSLSTISRSTVRCMSLTNQLASAENITAKEVDDLFAEKPQYSQENRRRHAFSVNKVELMGGVALDPIFKTAKNNKPYLLFNLITNHGHKQADGTFNEQSERHSITVFGQKAEALRSIVKKGARLTVQGRLHYSGGVKDEAGNRTPRNTYIIAQSVEEVQRFQGENEEKRQ